MFNKSARGGDVESDLIGHGEDLGGGDGGVLAVGLEERVGDAVTDLRKKETQIYDQLGFGLIRVRAITLTQERGRYWVNPPSQEGGGYW